MNERRKILLELYTELAIKKDTAYLWASIVFLIFSVTTLFINGRSTALAVAAVCFSGVILGVFSVWTQSVSYLINMAKNTETRFQQRIMLSVDIWNTCAFICGVLSNLYYLLTIGG